MNVSENLKKSAYGSRASGGPFDISELYKNPQMILRIIGWVFSIIVFGCIAQKVYQANVCQLNAGSSACTLAVATGVFTFMTCVGFFVSDVMFSSISSVPKRKRIVIADISFSAFWTLLWFINFCSLTNNWRKTEKTKEVLKIRSPVQAAILFSFFSIFIWVGLTFLAYRRYKDRQSTLFTDASDDSGVFSTRDNCDVTSYVGPQAATNYNSPTY